MIPTLKTNSELLKHKQIKINSNFTTYMSKEFEDLINEANKTYLENFPNTTCFERAVFFSWSCQLEECCKYCYMSTLPKEKRTNDS